MIGHQTNCRLCKSTKLEKYLDLGWHVPSDSFRKDKDTIQKKYPLQVCLCTDCGLSQLTYNVDPKELYQDDYPYESSTTEGGKKHYFEFAESVVDKFKLTNESLVIDIGSNVGVLLEGFKNKGAKILGIDPAQNIVDIANDRGIETLCEFFSEAVAKTVKDKYGSASVITGTNVFAHVDNLDDFMNGIKLLLNNNGVFIFESPNLKSLVKENAYSSVYHEHLSYLSLKPVMKFMEKHGLEVFHVEERDIHEGSFRVFVAKKGTRYIGDSVGAYVYQEDEAGIHKLETLKAFAEKAEKHKEELVKTIKELRNDGWLVVALSAPAKGATLVQYCKLEDDIAFATEKSTLKLGRFMPGTNIEVKPDKALDGMKVTVGLLLAWNFGAEIMRNNKAFQDNGNKFLIPFPEIRVV